MRQLFAEPRSRFRAVIAGWAYPISREAMIQLEQYDLHAARYLPRGKFKPYPRPWAGAARVNKSKKKRTAGEVLARLRPNRAIEGPPPSVG